MSTTNDTTASLRVLDGRLLKLAAVLAPAAPEAGKEQARAEIVRLMARRAELVRPRQAVHHDGPFGGAR